jgi:hypothetical protein
MEASFEREGWGEPPKINLVFGLCESGQIGDFGWLGCLLFGYDVASFNLSWPIRMLELAAPRSERF